MHMADALLTPAVAGVMYAASAVVAGASIVELHKEEKQDLTLAAKKLPTMAVMSALVFAGQMINYTIPGTGSSGHLCGGLLLTSVLGPWAGFLSMIVILTIQCLFLADGGLMALGNDAAGSMLCILDFSGNDECAAYVLGQMLALYRGERPAQETPQTNIF